MTATSAVAIGITPNTTLPCEASTVCMPKPINSGNRMATHSMAMMSCGHSARGGHGRRSATSSASAQSPASAARIAVNATGSMADTASRVAGKVPPKITMPTKPSKRPRRAREEDEAMTCVAEDMARFDSGFASRRTADQSVHMAAMRG